MIFHEQPREDWTRFDFLLLEAYQRLQDEICPRCGHPVWLCRSNSRNITFSVKSGVCYSDRALKAAEVNRMSDKTAKAAALKDKKNWGEFYYTIPVKPPTAEGELPTREEYYAELRVE